jgi:hypothetical protein
VPRPHLSPNQVAQLPPLPRTAGRPDLCHYEPLHHLTAAVPVCVGPLVVTVPLCRVFGHEVLAGRCAASGQCLGHRPHSTSPLASHTATLSHPQSPHGDHGQAPHTVRPLVGNVGLENGPAPWTSFGHGSCSAMGYRQARPTEPVGHGLGFSP